MALQWIQSSFKKKVLDLIPAMPHFAFIMPLSRRDFSRTSILRYLRKDFSRPPTSPNINPCHHFLCEYMKDRCFRKILINFRNWKLPSNQRLQTLLEKLYPMFRTTVFFVCLKVVISGTSYGIRSNVTNNFPSV
jgi:hypothetical protein